MLAVSGKNALEDTNKILQLVYPKQNKYPSSLGNLVFLKRWRQEFISDQLQLKWSELYKVNISNPTLVKLQEICSWVH